MGKKNEGNDLGKFILNPALREICSGSDKLKNFAEQNKQKNKASENQTLFDDVPKSALDSINFEPYEYDPNGKTPEKTLKDNLEKKHIKLTDKEVQRVLKGQEKIQLLTQLKGKGLAVYAFIKDHPDKVDLNNFSPEVVKQINESQNNGEINLCLRNNGIFILDDTLTQQPLGDKILIQYLSKYDALKTALDVIPNQIIKEIILTKIDYATLTLDNINSNASDIAELANLLSIGVEKPAMLNEMDIAMGKVTNIVKNSFGINLDEPDVHLARGQPLVTIIKEEQLEKHGAKIQEEEKQREQHQILIGFEVGKVGRLHRTESLTMLLDFEQAIEDPNFPGPLKPLPGSSTVNREPLSDKSIASFKEIFTATKGAGGTIQQKPSNKEDKGTIYLKTGMPLTTPPNNLGFSPKTVLPGESLPAIFSSPPTSTPAPSSQTSANINSLKWYESQPKPPELTIPDSLVVANPTSELNPELSNLPPHLTQERIDELSEKPLSEKQSSAPLPTVPDPAFDEVVIPEPDFTPGLSNTPLFEDPIPIHPLSPRAVTAIEQGKILSFEELEAEYNKEKQMVKIKEVKMPKNPALLEGADNPFITTHGGAVFECQQEARQLEAVMDLLITIAKEQQDNPESNTSLNVVGTKDIYKELAAVIVKDLGIKNINFGPSLNGNDLREPSPEVRQRVTTHLDNNNFILGNIISRAQETLGLGHSATLPPPPTATR